MFIALYYIDIIYFVFSNFVFDFANAYTVTHAQSKWFYKSLSS